MGLRGRLVGGVGEIQAATWKFFRFGTSMIGAPRKTAAGQPRRAAPGDDPGDPDRDSGRTGGLPLCGSFADRFGPRPVYLSGAVLRLILAGPVFGFANYRQDGLIWIGLVGVLSIGPLIGSVGGLIGSVGGLAAGSLLQFDQGKPWWLVGYIVAVSVVTILSVLGLPETAPRRTA
jgi:hypothetical protein